MCEYDCPYTAFPGSLKMIIRQGRFVEFSVFGKETSVDWTVISDAKGLSLYCYTVPIYNCFYFP